MRKWIFPANPKIYDIDTAFNTEENIIWYMPSNVEIGDQVYFYIGSPNKQIQYLCEVTDLNIPIDLASEQIQKYVLHKKADKKFVDNFISLKLIKNFNDNHALTFPQLRNNGLKGNIITSQNLYNNKFLMYYLESHSN